MSNQSVGNRVQSELTQAVESGLLPESVKDKAAQLLTRLQKPVRLALMGMPGSGKSTLLNLLVGSDVLPEGARLPTLQLSFGPTAQSICTLPDGTKETLVGADSHEIAALAPVFVDIHLPLPALAKISILEVVAPNDPTAVHRASQWASKRSDVALWCTQEFNSQEQQIWAQMPDQTKDHAFLMVTQADTLQANGTYDDVMAAVRSIAIEEFNQILPISTISAISARRPDGGVDKEKMRNSGGLALIQAVLKQVDQGRQSAVDMADVLLRQNAKALAKPDEIAEPEVSEPTPEPEVEVEAPAPKAPQAEVIAPVEEPAAPSGIDRLKEIAAKAKIDTDAPEGLKPATREAYQHVVAYLEDQGSELIAALEDMGTSAPSEIMALTVEHIQWLSDYLNDNGDDADTALHRARDTAFDAADMVQLMQMEKRDSAALEAVSLMLQIKRELQADLAA
jgi:hypothetical protein